MYLSCRFNDGTGGFLKGRKHGMPRRESGELDQASIGIRDAMRGSGVAGRQCVRGGRWGPRMPSSSFEGGRQSTCPMMSRRRFFDLRMRALTADSVERVMAATSSVE